MLQRLIMCVFVGWTTWMICTSAGLYDNLDQTDYEGPGLASLIRTIKIKSTEQFLSSYKGFKLPDEIDSKSELDNTKATIEGITMKTGEKHHQAIMKDVNTGLDSHHVGSQLKRNKLLQNSSNSKQDSMYKDTEHWFEHLQHHYPALSDYLPQSHWPTLFGYYNITLRGQYLTILPPILLSVPVTVSDAKKVHNGADPNDEYWKPSEDTDEDQGSGRWWEESADGGLTGSRYGKRTPFIPSSSGEMIVTCILAIPAVLVVVYTTVWLYRCVCSRHYAEWREQWWSGEQAEARAQIIGECVPVPLLGHTSDIECVCTDGSVVVSACLSGTIKVWDPVTSECISTLDRSNDIRRSGTFQCDEWSSDYESGSPKSQPDSFIGISQSPVSIWQPAADESENQQLYSNKFSHFPDFTPTINTNFTSLFAPSSERRLSLANNSYKVPTVPSPVLPSVPPSRNMKRNYSSDSLASRKHSMDHLVYEDRFKPHRHFNKNYFKSSSTTCAPPSSNLNPFRKSHKRNLSAGNAPLFVSGSVPPQQTFSKTLGSKLHSRESQAAADEPQPSSLVWALECQEGLVFAGCSNGTIEVWDGYSGSLKHVTEEGESITSLAVSGSKLIAARISGFIDIYTIKVTDDSSSCSPSTNVDSNAPYRRQASSNLTHRRTGSFGRSFPHHQSPAFIDADNYSVCLIGEASKKAHHQPLSVLCCDDSRILTGSLDHSLKVFDLHDAHHIFTLHGHTGPITTAIIGGPVGGTHQGGDAVVYVSPPENNLEGAIIASGAQDGCLCVWDVITGACVYSVTGHSEAVISIVISSSYLISLAADDKLAVWERFQGHLLNTLHVTDMFCSSVIMLTSKLLITTRQGRLCVWDVSTGTEVLEVSLGDTGSSVYPRHLLTVGANVICDYGNTLRTVRMPVAEKIE